MQNELIVVKQLPIIEEQLRTLKDTVEKRVSEALALECTEATVQAVKEVRTNIRRDFDEIEQRRKAVKKMVLDPYEKFEAIYKECVSEQFSKADTELARKIRETEDGIKSRCENLLKSYFAELCDSLGVDFLTFQQSGIKVDLASAKAKTPKKLMEQVKLFVEGVSQDVSSILAMPDAAEIMSEYKAVLNIGIAISTVQNRHRRIEEERQRAEALAMQRKEESEHEQALRAVVETSPSVKPIKAAPQKITISFTVTDTVERLKLLREYLRANNYDYK